MRLNKALKDFRQQGYGESLLMGQTVGIEVRELKPELLQDYLQFFDQAFSDFPQWADCYCGFYDTSEADWDATSKAGPEHRAARSALISASKAQGLLAYVDDRPVGIRQLLAGC